MRISDWSSDVCSSDLFDHFPEDLIANSAMTMILGLHDMHHDRAARRLGLKRENLKWIKPKQTALVQVRSGSNAGLTNTFKEVILSASCSIFILFTRDRKSTRMNSSH